jgi:hypothetical protein
MRQLAFHLDCPVFAAFFAYPATDTADCAVLAYGFSPVMGVATYADVFAVGYHFDKPFGASFYANPASGAFFVVDYGDAVNDFNRIKHTGLDAASAAQASVGTSLGTAADQADGGAAVFNALVLKEEEAMLVASDAFDIGGQACGNRGVDTHDVRNPVIQFRASHGAAVGFGFPGEHILGEGTAPCASATAAVDPGKDIL